ncbi:MAG: DUF4365 domain-containing protein [Thermoguttaceae bacterium]|nr:DUF4365 domain-containing protein [Thermoguttaceae bacterium]
MDQDRANLNDIKEELSYAALHAIVSQAGGGCTKSGRKADNSGCDAYCDLTGPFSDNPRMLRSVTLKVQLKGSSHCSVKKNLRDELFWKLPIKYDQLKKYCETPNLILCLFIYPPDEEQLTWLNVTEEQLTLRKSMYWTALTGVLEANEDGEKAIESKTIYIPQKNLLTPETLMNNVVKPIADHKELRYEGL